MKKVIRASEIGAYVYCRRAWWLKRVAGFEPENRNFDAGIAAHARYGRQYSRARWQRRLAFLFIGLAILLLIGLIIL
jgi:hypothetical protein